MKTAFQRIKTRRSYLLETTLLVFGMLCLGFFVYSWAEGRLSQSYQSYQLDAELAGRPASLSGFVAELFGRPPERSTPPRDLDLRIPAMQTGSIIGRIEIPRIQISTVVKEGSDNRTLRNAAGHIPSTVLPGQKGNVGVAAHRDSFFRNLKSVKEGDKIRMVTTWGTFDYQVDKLKIVDPENIEVLRNQKHSQLTLVTCYPFNYVGSAPKRFIVQARQLESSTLTPASSSRTLKKTIAPESL